MGLSSDIILSVGVVIMQRLDLEPLLIFMMSQCKQLYAMIKKNISNLILMSTFEIP